VAYEQQQRFYKCHEEHYRDGAGRMTSQLKDALVGFMIGYLDVRSEGNFGLEEDMDNIKCRHFKSRDLRPKLVFLGIFWAQDRN